MQNKKRYTAVLFDLDGTLVDSWPAIELALTEVFKEQYPGKSTAHITALREVSPFGNAALLRGAFPEREDGGADLYARLHVAYSDAQQRALTLFDGVERVLTALAERDMPWGIVTNKSRRSSKQCLALSEPLSAARCLVCPDDVTHPKPHPEPIVTAALQLPAELREVLFVGDSVVDVQAARAAGVDCAVCRHGYGHDAAEIMRLKPTYVIDRFDELSEILNRDS